jgi:sialate O-acetylesterase
MKRTLFISLIILFVTNGMTFAKITLPDVLNSGMVLQQHQKVPVWGTANPGEKVSVSFAGQNKVGIADKSGQWKVWLNPMAASNVPQKMTITGLNTVILNDVLVGEVWLCAGQSNMQLILSSTNKGDSVIASANYPMLRLFNVSRAVAFKHQTGPLATWQKCSPASVKEFSAAAYYFGLALQKKLKVPVGIINASYGGSEAEAWTPIAYLHTPDLQPCIDREKIWDAERPQVRKEYAETLIKWREYAAKERAAGRIPKEAPHPPDALREYRIAASIYNGMIAPLIPFKIKGVIWYQGENNEGRAEQYGILLPTMIRAWRATWHQGNFPFGIVQLPNYRDPNNQPVETAWSDLRDAQRCTADTVKNAGLIVTIDIGEKHNIHSKDKYDVGKRMYLWALDFVYHYPVMGSGPIFQQDTVEGKTIMIKFKEVGTGLQVKNGGTLQEFAIAGADKQWHWAKAKIVGKNLVKVWSNDVPNPIAVRYAFNSNPRTPNLTNNSGLPAAPFRSDNWPGPTAGKR